MCVLYLNLSPHPIPLSHPFDVVVTPNLHSLANTASNTKDQHIKEYQSCHYKILPLILTFQGRRKKNNKKLPSQPPSMPLRPTLMGSNTTLSEMTLPKNQTPGQTRGTSSDAPPPPRLQINLKGLSVKISAAGTFEGEYSCMKYFQGLLCNEEYCVKELSVSVMFMLAILNTRVVIMEMH